MKNLLSNNPLSKIVVTAVAAAALLPLMTAGLFGAAAFYGLATVGAGVKLAGACLAAFTGWSVGGWLSYHSVRRFAVRTVDKTTPMAVDAAQGKIAEKIAGKFIGVSVKSPAGQGAAAVATVAEHHAGADSAPPAPAQGLPQAVRKPL